MLVVWFVCGVSRSEDRGIRFRNTAAGSDKGTLNSHLIRRLKCIREVSVQLANRKYVRVSLWRHFDDVPAEEVDALSAKHAALDQVQVFLFGPLLEVRRARLFQYRRH